MMVWDSTVWRNLLFASVELFKFKANVELLSLAVNGEQFTVQNPRSLDVKCHKKLSEIMVIVQDNLDEAMITAESAAKQKFGNSKVPKKAFK